MLWCCVILNRDTNGNRDSSYIRQLRSRVCSCDIRWKFLAGKLHCLLHKELICSIVIVVWGFLHAWQLPTLPVYSDGLFIHTRLLELGGVVCYHIGFERHSTLASEPKQHKLVDNRHHSDVSQLTFPKTQKISSHFFVWWSESIKFHCYLQYPIRTEQPKTKHAAHRSGHPPPNPQHTTYRRPIHFGFSFPVVKVWWVFFLVCHGLRDRYSIQYHIYGSLV